MATNTPAQREPASPGLTNKITIIYILGTSPVVEELASEPGFYHISDAHWHKPQELIQNIIVPQFLRGNKVFLLQGFPRTKEEADKFGNGFYGPHLILNFGGQEELVNQLWTYENRDIWENLTGKMEKEWLMERIAEVRGEGFDAKKWLGEA